MRPASAPGGSRPCRIVIRGRLSRRLESAFPELALERGPGQTVLQGSADATGMRELLDRLGDLGLEPLSVEVDAHVSSTPAGGDAAVLGALRAGDERAFLALL